MKRIIAIVSFCVLYMAGVMAQEIVSGTVIDKDGYPIPGARVEIVGRSEYAMTDIDGTFRIELPVTARKIVVSYPGYNPIERDIKPDMVVIVGKGWEAMSSGYRGFFDFVGGWGFGGEVNVRAGMNEINDIRHALTFGWSMTHGYQINSHLFAGLGFGFNAEMLYADRVNGTTEEYYGYPDGGMSFYSLDIPVYADLRWDFGLAKKTAPFVDVKIGYQACLAFDKDDSIFESYSYRNNRSSNISVYGEGVGGFFLQPSIGLRTGIGGKCGMNIGLSYNTMVKKKLKAVYEYNDWNDYNNNISETKDLGVSTGGVLMLNIGFDF